MNRRPNRQPTSAQGTRLGTIIDKQLKLAEPPRVLDNAAQIGQECYFGLLASSLPAINPVAAFDKLKSITSDFSKGIICTVVGRTVVRKCRKMPKKYIFLHFGQ